MVPLRVLELLKTRDLALQLLDLPFSDSPLVVLVLERSLKHVNILGLVDLLF